MTATMKQIVSASDLDDWYRFWDVEGREILSLSGYNALAHGETGGLTTGGQLDSIWDPAGLVPLIENVEFRTTTSDHRAVRYLLHAPEDINVSPVDLGLGASLWRLHPGVLADLQSQTSLIEWAEAYLRTEQSADPGGGRTIVRFVERMQQQHEAGRSWL